MGNPDSCSALTCPHPGSVSDATHCEAAHLVHDVTCIFVFILLKCVVFAAGNCSLDVSCMSTHNHLWLFICVPSLLRIKSFLEICLLDSSPQLMR